MGPLRPAAAGAPFSQPKETDDENCKACVDSVGSDFRNRSARRPGKACGPELAKAVEGLRGLLTPEQRNAREEALASGKKHREVLATLNLTPEQKEKVGAACKECCTAIKGELEKIKDALSAQEKERL